MLIRKRKKGQAILEMALVFPFFLLVIIGGLIDFGFAFYNFLSLQQIANETAQWAAESLGNGQVQSNSAIMGHAHQRRPAWWTGTFSVAQPQKIPLATDGGKSECISVTITYNSPTYTPFYQTLFQAAAGEPSIRLAAQAAYKIPKFVHTR